MKDFYFHECLFCAPTSLFPTIKHILSTILLLFSTILPFLHANQPFSDHQMHFIDHSPLLLDHSSTFARQPAFSRSSNTFYRPFSFSSSRPFFHFCALTSLFPTIKCILLSTILLFFSTILPLLRANQPFPDHQMHFIDHPPLLLDYSFIFPHAFSLAHVLHQLYVIFSKTFISKQNFLLLIIE